MGLFKIGMSSISDAPYIRGPSMALFIHWSNYCLSSYSSAGAHSWIPCFKWAEGPSQSKLPGKFKWPWMLVKMFCLNLPGMHHKAPPFSELQSAILEISSRLIQIILLPCKCMPTIAIVKEFVWPANRIENLPLNSGFSQAFISSYGALLLALGPRRHGPLEASSGDIAPIAKLMLDLGILLPMNYNAYAKWEIIIQLHTVFSARHSLKNVESTDQHWPAVQHRSNLSFVLFVFNA